MQKESDIKQNSIQEQETNTEDHQETDGQDQINPKPGTSRGVFDPKKLTKNTPARKRRTNRAMLPILYLHTEKLS